MYYYKYTLKTTFVSGFIQISSDFDSHFLVLRGPRVTWYRPTSLSELLHLKSKYPQAKIVNGNTELGKQCTNQINSSKCLTNLRYLSVKIINKYLI